MFSVNLSLAFSLVFSAMNALYHYVLVTKADAFNVVLAIVLTIFYGVGLVALWIRTSQMKHDEPRDGKVFSIDKAKVESVEGSVEM